MSSDKENFVISFLLSWLHSDWLQNILNSIITDPDAGDLRLMR